jgi:serine/threonine-protein kinase HipA
LKYRLQVRLGDTAVGTLEQEPQSHGGRVLWTPDAAWIRGGQSPRLGAAFLRDPSPKRTNGLPPWFENLLPERNSALRTRITQGLGLSEGSSFALLERLGADLPGDVRVTNDGAARPKPRALERAIAQERPSKLPSSSLAGMQLKFSMSMEGERLALNAQGAGRIWIVKLPGDRFADLVEVEAATTEWARRAGHEVPAHRIVPFAALHGLPEWALHTPNAFIVERFDRLTDGGRQHHEDLCQAFDLPPERKGGDVEGGAITYASVARLVRDLAGHENALRLARRLGFMLASGNGDLHLKNLSLVWPADAAQARLSPCYDLVATIAWPEFGWAEQVPKLALWFGQTKRFADVDLAQVGRVGQEAGVDGFTEEVQRGIEAAAKAYRPDECPGRMRDALREHARRVPVLKPHQAAFGSD